MNFYPIDTDLTIAFSAKAREVRNNASFTKQKTIALANFIAKPEYTISKISNTGLPAPELRETRGKLNSAM